MMHQLVLHVNNRVVNLIEATPIEEVSTHSEALEAFFNFLTMVAKKMPTHLLESGIDLNKLIAQSKHFHIFFLSFIHLIGPKFLTRHPSLVYIVFCRPQL